MLGLELLKLRIFPIFVFDQVLKNENLILGDLIQGHFFQILDNQTHVFQRLVGPQFELISQLLQLDDHLGKFEAMILTVSQSLFQSVQD